MTPHRLASLRRVRADHLGGTAGSYALLDHVREELAYARQLTWDHPGWTSLDVTDKPIEEVASEILRILKGSTTGERAIDSDPTGPDGPAS